MKLCSKCGDSKDENEFNWRNIKRGIRSSNCKKCQSEYHKSYFNRHKKDYKETRYRLREIKRSYVYDFLIKNPCIDCGEADPIVLDFDHLRNKSAQISTMLRNGCGIKSIQNEIKKCVVRCSNCHRIKTAKECGNWKMGR